MDNKIEKRELYVLVLALILLLATIIFGILYFTNIYNYKDCRELTKQQFEIEKGLKEEIQTLEDSVDILRARIDDVPDSLSAYVHDLLEQIKGDLDNYGVVTLKLKKDLNSGRLTILQSVDSVSYYRHRYNQLLGRYQELLGSNAILLSDNNRLNRELKLEQDKNKLLNSEIFRIDSIAKKGDYSMGELKDEINELKNFPKITHISFRGLENAKGNKCNKSEMPAYNTKKLKYFEVGVELKDPVKKEVTFKYKIINTETKDIVLTESIKFDVGMIKCYIHKEVPNNIVIKKRQTFKASLYLDGEEVAGTELTIDKGAVLF